MLRPEFQRAARFLSLRYVVCMNSTVVVVWDNIERGGETELESRAIPKRPARTAVYVACAPRINQGAHIE